MIYTQKLNKSKDVQKEIDLRDWDFFFCHIYTKMETNQNEENNKKTRKIKRCDNNVFK